VKEDVKENGERTINKIIIIKRKGKLEDFKTRK